MNVRACSIRLLDETGSRLRVAAVHGLANPTSRRGPGGGAEPLVREVLAGRVIAVADVRTDTRLQYRAQALIEGINSMLSAPLQGKHGPLGLIRAYSADLDHFTEEDATFLAAMAAKEASPSKTPWPTGPRPARRDEIHFVLMVTHELRPRSASSGVCCGP